MYQVGGLGDVVTGLARACLARGHHVEVILPFYECIPDKSVEGLCHEMDFDCPKARYWDGSWRIGSLQTSVWKGQIAGGTLSTFYLSHHVQDFQRAHYREFSIGFYIVAPTRALDFRIPLSTSQVGSTLS